MSPEESALRLQSEQRLKSSARWYYWIAGLTLVTSLMAISGSGWRFIVSLGLTQVIDAIAIELATNLGSVPKIIALVLDVIISGVFVFLGFMAGKRHSWSFIVGIILFGFDSLIFVVGSDWIGVAFHAYVLVCLFMGFNASRKLNALDRETETLNARPDASVFPEIVGT
jgi:hypothetical protein